MHPLSMSHHPYEGCRFDSILGRAEDWAEEYVVALLKALLDPFERACLLLGLVASLLPCKTNAPTEPSPCQSWGEGSRGLGGQPG